MALAHPASTGSIPGWLEEIGRDPRTVGAFRRRIESLLQDGAIARRVALRLEQRRDAGQDSPPETDRDEAVWPDRQTGQPRHTVGARRAEAARPAGQGTFGHGAVVGSLIGRCDCATTCCMMVPNLGRFPAFGFHGRPSAMRAPALRH